jgi:hypothetical protein
MKPSMIFAVVLLLLAQLAYAQNFSKTGVLKMSLRNSGAILQDNQVKGYYFFYNLEKKDRKNNNYLLSVYDENLREINAVNIVRPVDYLLVDGAFNGDAFGFLFYDTRNKTIELIAYDRTLKEAGFSKRVLKSRSSQASYVGIATGQAASQAFLVPVSHKGFLYYGLKDDKKYHFQTEFYDNTMKQVWSIQAPQTAQDVETASEAFQSDRYIGSLILKKKNLSSKDLDTDLMVQQAEDGKILFKIPMETKQYSISYSDVYFDAAKQNFVVFGEYYNLKDKELKSQSLGFIYVTVDLTGKIVDEKINSWEKEISRVTVLNEKGKFEGSNTNTLVHDIIRTSDGQIFVVGEQYKKAASAAGIASNILGVAAAAAGGGIYSSASNVQLNVYNLVIFQFNPDYTINKVHIFEKDKNVVSLPSGATYSSSKLLSYYARAVGGFDYTFSQVASDKNTFIVTYINYDREKGEKAKNLLGAVVYTPEKVFSVDKMALNRKSTEYFVLRAKEGYVLITEYFKKEKRIDSRLEKINF